MDTAEKANQPKKQLNESCKHEGPCVCNSYLCESCYPPKAYDKVKGGDAPKKGKDAAKEKEVDLDDGQMSPMSKVQEITEDFDYSDKADALQQWADKYSEYYGCNGDRLPWGMIEAMTNTGITTDGWEQNE